VGTACGSKKKAKQTAAETTAFVTNSTIQAERAVGLSVKI